MIDKDLQTWIGRSIYRLSVLLSMWQPCSASEVADWLDMNQSSCSKAFRQLAHRGVLTCLNPKALRHRIYWLTRKGMQYQKTISTSLGIRVAAHHHPEKLDWTLYGELSYPHRRAVLKAMRDPMQPAAIRRLAVRKDSTLRMSANNARDVVKELRKRGLVVAVPGRRRRSHKLYVLTQTGRAIQELLESAEQTRYGLRNLRDCIRRT